MLTPQALTAAIATFTGVWALFLSGLTPVLTAEHALRPAILFATTKELTPRALPGTLKVASGAVEAEPLAALPPRAKRRAARHIESH